MGIAAKITLLCAMVAIVLGAQLLEREIAAERAANKPVREPRHARASAAIVPLLVPVDDPGLPAVPDVPPGGGAQSGTPGVSSDDAAPANAAGERAYVIQPGDTLAKIAKRTLGKETAWQLIYQRNKAAIPDVARLKVGTTLEIPALARPARAASTAPDDARRVPPRKLTTGRTAR